MAKLTTPETAFSPSTGHRQLIMQMNNSTASTVMQLQQAHGTSAPRADAEWADVFDAILTDARRRLVVPVSSAYFYRLQSVGASGSDAGVEIYWDSV